MFKFAEILPWVAKALIAVGLMTKKGNPQADSDEKPDLHIEIKQDLIKFIVRLGYTTEQGEAFAEGYAAEFLTLNDRCMAVGFRVAGIDEEEALGRFNQSSGLPERKYATGVTKTQRGVHRIR